MRHRLRPIRSLAKVKSRSHSTPGGAVVIWRSGSARPICTSPANTAGVQRLQVMFNWPPFRPTTSVRPACLSKYSATAADVSASLNRMNHCHCKLGVDASPEAAHPVSTVARLLCEPVQPVPITFTTTTKEKKAGKHTAGSGPADGSEYFSTLETHRQARYSSEGSSSSGSSSKSISLSAPS